MEEIVLEDEPCVWLEEGFGVGVWSLSQPVLSPATAQNRTTETTLFKDTIFRLLSLEELIKQGLCQNDSMA